MPRTRSAIAPDWWDYTTLDAALLADAARLTPEDMRHLGRPGFRVVFYDTLEDFYLAEALEYITAWPLPRRMRRSASAGPIGPTEQLPLVARLVNELGLSLRHAHFWGMDEWVVDGREVPPSHPLSFERADRELCFDRIRPELRMPESHLHFPKVDTTAYRQSWDCRCALRGDAGRPGRREALGLQRPAASRRPLRGRAADAGRVPGARRRAWWTCIRSPSRRTPGPAAAATSAWCRRRR